MDATTNTFRIGNTYELSLGKGWTICRLVSLNADGTATVHHAFMGVSTVPLSQLKVIR